MKLSSGWGLKFVSRRALEQVSALWSKGSVFKFVILEVVPCKGPDYQLGSPYSSKVKYNELKSPSLPLSVKVEGLPKSFVNTQ